MIWDINEILGNWAENVINQIKSNLDSTGTTASGKTKESLEYTVENGELYIYGRQFFEGVEQGRPAGRIPYNMTDIIRQWMKDKGIEGQFGETESQKRSAAYLIGQFIKKNGTRLYRNGGREDIYTNVIDEELPELWEQINGTVVSSIVKEIK